jgi:hypothetical protein
MAAGGGRDAKNPATTLSRLKSAKRVITESVRPVDEASGERKPCKKNAHAWLDAACVRCGAERPSPAA